MLSNNVLPLSVNVCGVEYKIRNDCDYRVVIDVISAINDEELTQDERWRCALFVFYGEAIFETQDFEEAIKKMFWVINEGEEPQQSGENEPRLMDWEYDFGLIVAPVSRVLGYDVRQPRFTHWWSFLAAYREIGECTFSTVVSIRQKRLKGKKLEKWEQDFCREHGEMVNLPKRLSREDVEFLYGTD